MSRQRAFDPGEVLERAMRLFWRQGYEATSIQDLVAATGINRASMYAAFGGKRELFRAAVAHYLQRVNAARLRRLESAESPKAGIRRFFAELVEFSLGEGRQLGCLLTNSALELAPHDRELALEIATVFTQVEQAFAAAVVRAQERGEIPADKDPRALARFLMNAVQGLRVQARLAPERERLQDIVAVTLKALD